jgi:hypothetical protein
VYKLATIISACAFFLCAAPLSAQSADTVQPGVLQIAGQTQNGKVVSFTLTDLERLPHTTITTKTPWYSGSTTFEGVLVRDLMAAVGAKGSKFEAGCLDKYIAVIPGDDWTKHGLLIAYKRDGVYMPITDKGPYMLVYPFDSDPALQTAKYYGRSAWQLASITIE